MTGNSSEIQIQTQMHFDFIAENSFLNTEHRKHTK